MGRKNTFHLLSGATSTGAGSGVFVGQYQKNFIIECLETAEVTPDYTFELQYKSDGGTWETFYDQAVTGASNDPVLTSITDYPWTDIRVNISAYSTGTIDVNAYAI